MLQNEDSCCQLCCFHSDVLRPAKLCSLLRELFSMSEPANDATAKETPANKSDEAKSLWEVTLSGAIALARESDDMTQANQQFEALLTQVEAESPAAAPLLRQLWQALTSVQRSAAFWQVMSDAEKDLSDKMSATNIQLKQNYMRLIQEQ